MGNQVGLNIYIPIIVGIIKNALSKSNLLDLLKYLIPEVMDMILE